ncbi:MAG TPA: CRISPR-associated endoribonuclease Cas6, partial [Aquificaceae bacterium]|nr:CRISPR-associated endoribonuclease Cas6 [Aquificaceae bacterium]
MRLRALLNYKELPILYRHKVLSLIKSALERSDK